MGKRKFNLEENEGDEAKVEVSPPMMTETAKPKLNRNSSLRLKELMKKPGSGDEKRGRSLSRKETSKKSRNGSQDQGERLEQTTRRLTGTKKALAESHRKADEREVIVHESKTLWEKMKSKKVPEDSRNEMIGQLWSQVNGNIMEIIHKHDVSRVIQTLLRFISSSSNTTINTTDKNGNTTTITCQQIFESFFAEIGPNLAILSKELYAHHTVERTLEALSIYCKKNKGALETSIVKLEGYFGGRLTGMSTHIIASKIVAKLFDDFESNFIKSELLYGYGKRNLIEALYDIPLTLQDAVLTRLKNLIDKLLAKSDLLALKYSQYVIRYYLTICDKLKLKERIIDLLPQLAEYALDFLLSSSVDGSQIVIFCANYSSAKLRKKMQKSLKGHISTILNLTESHPTIALMRLIMLTDDTSYCCKFVLQELVISEQDIAATDEGVQYTATGEAAGFNYPALVWLLCCSSSSSSECKYSLLTNQPPSSRAMSNTAKFIINLLLNSSDGCLLEEQEKRELDLNLAVVNVPLAMDETSDTDAGERRTMVAVGEQEGEVKHDQDEKDGDGKMKPWVTWPLVQSKKTLESKTKELYDFMASSIEILCREYSQVLMRSVFGGKIFEEFAKKSCSACVFDGVVSSIERERLEQDANIDNDDGKKRKSVVDLPLIEHPSGHLVIRHLLKHELESPNEGFPMFCMKLAQALSTTSVDVICTWLSQNRPSFIILDLLAIPRCKSLILSQVSKARTRLAKKSKSGGVALTASAGATHVFKLIDELS